MEQDFQNEGREEDEGADRMLRSEASFFSSWGFVKSFLKDVCSPQWESLWPREWEKLCSELLVFQEQPSLLSPYLEEIVVPLTEQLLGVLEEELGGRRRFQRIENKQIHAICKVLQLFCRIRGFKYVIKYFPHDVSHVEICMMALEAQDRADFTNWETRYILLLWMCQLCLIPFDICSMDSSLTSQSTTDDKTAYSGHLGAGSAGQSRLVCDIIANAREHLSDAGPTREAAYACLSALFTRPDMEMTLLSDFMEWCCGRLDQWTSRGETAAQELTRDSFQLIGVLHTISQIFKKGHRNNVLPHAAGALKSCLSLSEQSNQALVRKLLAKAIQRLGLVFLPPREASWRYQRGSRSLVSNLKQVAVAPQPSDDQHDGSNDQQEDEVDVPEELEEVIEKLLCALQDKDTIVRWSAAKGIGRVTMRLPRAFGDDVVGAVIEVFSDEDDENAWHGGCLALAELCRRGLLLPHRLDAVVPLAVRAMHFDILRGQHSVGAHVRDAASYVCWAFARAYAPVVLRPFVGMFSEAMLLASLFDREVNCRRAASAAFQESVGRQGNENFPFGIEVIAVADYFSLGNRSHSYLRIAPLVAKLSTDFHHIFVDHLWQHKLGHWDAEIRRLAARSLGRLAVIDAGYLVEVLPAILSTCEAASTSMYSRHGGVLAVSEIVLSLCMSQEVSSGVHIPESTISGVYELVGKFDKGRMYRGRGGEQLREAVCELIESIARAQLAMPIKVQVAIVEVLNEHLRQPHEHIQSASARALRQMLFSYFPVTNAPSDRLQALTVKRYMEGISSDQNIAVVRGYSLALGALPMKLASKPSGRLIEVFACLRQAISPEHRIAGEPDAETRRNAVRSATELAERVVQSSLLHSKELNVDGDDPAIGIGYLFQLLAEACDDYSIDKRGDIGSWSRIAGMKGLHRVVMAVLRSPVYSPLSSGAQFSSVSGSESMHEIRKGSHIMTALGIARVVDDALLAAKIVTVQYPNASGAFDHLDNEDSHVKVKLSKDAVVLTEGSSSDLNSEDDPVLGDLSKREQLIAKLNCLPSNPSHEAVAASIDLDCIDVKSGVIAEREMLFVMRILLKQLGEKLDSVRDVAGSILEQLICCSDPVVDMIPDKPLITAAIDRAKAKSDSCIDGVSAPSSQRWTRTSTVYPFLCELLESKHYFDAIVSGIVISVGGLSEDVVKDSLDSLLKWCVTKKEAKNVRDLGFLSNALVQLFHANSRNSRVTLPLMKCFNALLRNGIFDFLHGHENVVHLRAVHSEDSSAHSFGESLWLIVGKEVKNCSEMAKLRAGIDLYLLLLLFEDPLRPKALKSLLLFLGHRYPKIRKYAAEQLYLQLISDAHAVGPPADEVMVPSEVESSSSLRRSGLARSADQLEKACSVLTCTVWSDSLEGARGKRQEVCECLDVELHVKTKQRGEGKRKEVADELDSYDALVRDAGY